MTATCTQLTGQDTVELRAVERILDGEDLYGGQCTEDVAIVAWMCAESAWGISMANTEACKATRD